MLHETLTDISSLPWIPCLPRMFSTLPCWGTFLKKNHSLVSLYLSLWEIWPREERQSQRQISQWIGLGNGRVWNEGKETRGQEGAFWSERCPFVEDKTCFFFCSFWMGSCCLRLHFLETGFETDDCTWLLRSALGRYTILLLLFPELFILLSVQYYNKGITVCII